MHEVWRKLPYLAFATILSAGLMSANIVMAEPDPGHKGLRQGEMNKGKDRSPERHFSQDRKPDHDGKFNRSEPGRDHRPDWDKGKDHRNGKNFKNSDERSSRR